MQSRFFIIILILQTEGLMYIQFAQRVVAVTGAFVLGKAVADDSASVGKVVSRVVAVVLVCALGNSAQCVNRNPPNPRIAEYL